VDLGRAAVHAIGEQGLLTKALAREPMNKAFLDQTESATPAPSPARCPITPVRRL
jgi:hypothetical protein